MRRIEQHTDRMTLPWTAGSPLPGGDFAPPRRAALSDEYAARYPFVPREVMARWFRSYGLEIDKLLNGATSIDDLGHDFGAGLFEVELSWLVSEEWARTREDVLWRRSKLGLKTADIDVSALDQWLERNAHGGAGSQTTTG